MDKNSDILAKINKDSGMTTPEGYFADFAKRMEQSLPNKEPQQEKIMPRSRWQQVRPYVYLAAMFTGIWCMLKMFTMMSPSENGLSIDNNPSLISALNDALFIEDFYSEENINSYDLLEEMYDEGISTDEFIEFTTLN